MVEASIIQEDVEDGSGDEDEHVVGSMKYKVTSYGSDYPVDALVKRLKGGDIYIPPFQRNFVWKKPQASRFIESLLLGLPVPGIFLALDQIDGRLLVVDGQQRLKSLLAFYTDDFKGNRFALTGVETQLEGKSYRTLEAPDRRRLDNSILHATIVEQKAPRGSNGSVYEIFERLNTGGVQLTPQEIRSCIFHGAFVECLEELNNHAAWRLLYGPKSERLKDHEMILRYLAFVNQWKEYKKPIKSFLNDFMERHQNLSIEDSSGFRSQFIPAVQLAAKAIGKRVFRPVRAFNAAYMDSILVGLHQYISRADSVDKAFVQKAYKSLIENEEFRSATEQGTANQDSVASRFSLAIAAFEE